MTAPTLFDTEDDLQTAHNGIIAIFGSPELGLSGEHRGVPSLAKELVKRHGDDYMAIGRELHDRECFLCWQAHSCPAYKPHTGRQVDEIVGLYADLIGGVAEGRIRLARRGQL